MRIDNVSTMIDLNQFDAARLNRASNDLGRPPEQVVQILVHSFLCRKGYHNLAGTKSPTNHGNVCRSVE